jgi:hypothetical protein
MSLCSLLLSKCAILSSMPFGVRAPSLADPSTDTTGADLPRAFCALEHFSRTIRTQRVSLGFQFIHTSLFVALAHPLGDHGAAHATGNHTEGSQGDESDNPSGDAGCHRAALAPSLHLTDFGGCLFLVAARRRLRYRLGRPEGVGRARRRILPSGGRRVVVVGGGSDHGTVVRRGGQ